MRECRAEGCPHLAADGCAFCVQHDEPRPFFGTGPSDQPDLMAALEESLLSRALPRFDARKDQK